MLEDQLITQEEYDEAIAEEIVLSPPQDKGTPMNNSVDTYVYNCATRALMENEGFVFQDTFFSEEEEETYTQEYNEMYTYCQNGKLIFGRNAISNDESFWLFKAKLKGYFNVWRTLLG